MMLGHCARRSSGRTVLAGARAGRLQTAVADTRRRVGMSEMTMTGEEIWSHVLPLLRERIGQATFEAVLKSTSALAYDGSSFTLSVPNDYVLRTLEDRHRPLIAACLQEVVQEPVDLKLRVVEVHSTLETLERPAAYAPPPAPAARHELYESGPLNPRFSFDNFVRGRLQPLRACRRPAGLPQSRAAATIHCSSTARPVWARPT